MIKDLNVAIVQSSIHWENRSLSLQHFADHLASLEGKNVDVVVLPEMFTTGFSMNASAVAESFSDEMESLAFMRHWSHKLDAVVTGSVSVEESGKYYNRLFWVRPDGTFSCYNKRHLFRMADEHQTYTAGDSLLVENWRGWKICPLICYDLRFPVWSRNRNDYDLLLYVANWPERRRTAWMKLLPARAIENQCYLVAVNRVGTDGKNMVYAGDSAAYA